MHSPPTSSPSAPLRRRPHLLRRAGRLVAAALLVAASVTLLLWLTLQWGILPRIQEWKPQIEARAGAALGVPVRIGTISVQAQGWVPLFELRDVSLLGRDGQPALQLARVRAALSPHSLWLLEPRLAQLHLEQVVLDIRRDRAGRFHVAGIEIDSAAGADHDDDNRVADWLFAQAEVVVRHSQVRWTDEQRGAPPLTLSDVDIVLRNGLRRHDLRIDATPPAEWGARLGLRGRFSAPLLAASGDWRRWTGSLYADAPAVDAAQLGAHIDLPFALSQGRGAARAWLEIDKGDWRDFSVDLALADVSLRLAPALAPLEITSLSGRVAAQRDGRGVQLRTQGLQVQGGDGVVWPAGDIALAWQQAQTLAAPARSVAAAASSGAAGVASPITGGRLDADRLDLAQLAAMAQRLPLGAIAEKWLAELQPAGVISGLQTTWGGAPDAPTAYTAKGRISGLALAASKPEPISAMPPAPAASHPVGRPGVSGADLDFDLDQTGGRANLLINRGALQLPGLFEKPTLPIVQAKAQLNWTVKAQAGAPAAIEIRLLDAKFSNADVQGDARGSWRTGRGEGRGVGARFPGVIDLSGRILRGNADRIAAYLPLAVPKRARLYVERAVRGGRVDGGTFAVRGDIWQFPFRNGTPDQVFRIIAKLRDVNFDYLPSVAPGGDEATWDSPWPGLSAAQGELVFDRSSIALSEMQARLWGVQLRGFSARIDDLVERPLLRVEGELRGPAAEVLRYVDVTPVGGWIGGGLHELRAEGAVDLKLALAIPILEPEKTSVRGSVALAGNDVRVRPGTPLLAGARGRVDFTQRGFQLAGASARVYGGEANLEGGTQSDGSLKFSAEGRATAQAMRSAPELGLLAQIAPALRGQTAYRAALSFKNGWPELSVSTDLVGIDSELPPPLAKAAATPLSTRWQTRVVADAFDSAGQLKPGQTALDTGTLEIGAIVRAQAQRRLSEDGPLLTTLAIGINDSPPAATLGAGPLPPGWFVNARLDSVDTDAWRAMLTRLAGPGEDGSGLPPMQISLRAAEITGLTRKLTQAQVEVRYDPRSRDEPWAAQVRAEQGAGRVVWTPPREAGDPGRVTARLTRLALRLSETAAVEQLLDQAPAQVPALDIVVDDFVLGARSLGRLDLQASTRASAVRAGVREWRLDRLDLGLPEARLQATGLWAPVPAGIQRRMVLDFSLDIQDGGALATRFGMAHTLRGGKGRLGGQLTWAGSPFEPDLQSLGGRLDVALEAGQFLRAEPGVGRLLGVLSLQALPRRLLLDFRDVFQEGFSFDSVQGEVLVVQGRAQTQNLRMRGVQALVLMAGSADLAKQTQDLRVIVAPEVNVGSASLAYAAINPAVGIGTFLAQLLLREPLRAAGTREFHITGPWGDPKVERVERGPDALVPSADAPASFGTAPASSSTPASPALAPPPNPPTKPPAARQEPR